MDSKADKILNDYFTLDDKIYPVELTILIIIILLVLGLAGVLSWFYYKNEFIFKPYSRDEGPPGTVRSTESRK